MSRDIQRIGMAARYSEAAVFNGVDDYRFDTGYGLLDAHGGYFARPSFYKRLAVRLGKVA